MKGDIVAGYTLLEELGSGTFSKVWKATRGGNEYAVKMFKQYSSVDRYFDNEFNMSKKIMEGRQEMQQSQQYGNNVLCHVDASPEQHCLVYELLGDHLGRLLRKVYSKHQSGLPIQVVKNIMRQIFTGIHLMHSCNIIHADIKPDNILMDRKADDLVIDADDPSRDVIFNVHIADIGSSSEEGDLFSYSVGTTEYIAPELVLELPYTRKVDIWSAFTMCFELVTGDLLFDVNGECNVDYGEGFNDSSDCSNSDCCSDDSNDSNNDEDNDESMRSSIVSDETDIEDTNYKLLRLMERLLGPMPKELAAQGRLYYNYRGQLKNDPEITPIGIHGLLNLNYSMEEQECKEFADFLNFGLRFDPEQRPTAEQVLQHPWLM